MGQQSSSTHAKFDDYADNGNSYSQLPGKASKKGKPFVSYEQRCNNKLLNVGFWGIWSNIETPVRETPPSRIGHFHVYDSVNSRVYIGYGLDSNEKTLNDVWYIDLVKRKWTKMEIHGYVPGPRTGASATFNGRYIFVFGGYNRPEFLDDLHAIDVTTGECRKLNTTGCIPTPRTNPVMGCYNNKLFVWGGFDRTFPTYLHSLDLNTLVWTEKDSDICGRRTAQFVSIEKDLYCYGLSRASMMIHIDMKDGFIEEQECSGSAPPYMAQCAGMAASKETIYWFGGVSDADFGFFRAYDIKTRWWFILHIRPDGESVNYSDGRTDSYGLFQIPVLWSYSLQYEEKTKELIGLFGKPMKNPQPLFIVNLGNAISSMHQRDDMLSMIRYE